MFHKLAPAEAQQRIYQQPLIMGGDADLSQKLVHLESEVASKKEEIASMREQEILVN
jgi:hypothetical protein